MATRVRSVRQEQLRLRASLVDRGKARPEIAEVFRSTYGVNLRVAFRLTQGWTQPQAAEEWNRRWPADPKTFKNFSYWEQWPSGSGYVPSLGVLARLAELYRCRASDLVADFSGLDPNVQANNVTIGISSIFSNGKGVPEGEVAVHGSELAISDVVDSVERIDIQDLARSAALWARRIRRWLWLLLDRLPYLVKVTSSPEFGRVSTFILVRVVRMISRQSTTWC